MTAPGLWPREAPRPGSSHGEAAVWTALKRGLPKGWYAWHSLRLKDGSSWIGEGDFVLAHPGRGVLVLEVKGGEISVRDGRYFSWNEPLKRAPLEQALDFKSLLNKRLASHRCQPPAVACAVCFPDTEFQTGPTEDVLDGRVIGKAQLPWIGESLTAIAQRALNPGDSVGQWIDQIHGLWGETWVPALTLGMRARALGESRFALTDNQLELLESLSENDRVLVQGGAGSGKTLLAAEAARREAASGRRVLLLCFTHPLMIWLKERLAGTGVDVRTISGLGWETVKGAGEAVSAPVDMTDGGYWRDTLLRAGDLITQRWDSVVIDEAQDFQEEAWLLVSSIAPAGTRLWAFHDPGQAFWPERTIPADLFAGATRLRLRGAKRCPSGIQALANRCLGAEHDDDAIRSAQTARVVGFVESPSAGSLPDKIGLEIDRMLSEGLAPGDIAVVSIRGQKAPEAIFSQKRIGRHSFVRADSPDMVEHVVADSFLRWKGLERPAVIVTDLPSAGSELKQIGVRMYVALTRALVCARVAGTRDQIASACPAL